MVFSGAATAFFPASCFFLFFSLFFRPTLNPPHEDTLRRSGADPFLAEGEKLPPLTGGDFRNPGFTPVYNLLIQARLTLQHLVAVFIISSKSFSIGDRIIHDIHRGVTYIKGIGAFTGEEKVVVNCVVNRFELAKVKDIVAEMDPQAFMYISDASEVMGKGFQKRGA